MKAQIVIEVEEEGLGHFLKVCGPSELSFNWKDPKDGYYHEITVNRVISYNGPYQAEPVNNITWREGGYNSPKLSAAGTQLTRVTDPVF